MRSSPRVIKADAQGVFAYAMPRAGWWGFAALLQGKEPMKAPDRRNGSGRAGRAHVGKIVDMDREEDQWRILSMAFFPRQ